MADESQVNTSSEDFTSLQTPTTAVSVQALRAKAEKLVATFEDDIKLYLQKLESAAAKALAVRELMLDESRTLLVQNNEKKTRAAVKPTVVGKAKIMSTRIFIKRRTSAARRKRAQSGRLA